MIRTILLEFIPLINSACVSIWGDSFHALTSHFTELSISSTLWRWFGVGVMTCCGIDAGTLTDAVRRVSDSLTTDPDTPHELSSCLLMLSLVSGQAIQGPVKQCELASFAMIAGADNSDCNYALIVNINQIHPSPLCPWPWLIWYFPPNYFCVISIYNGGDKFSLIAKRGNHSCL